jgi:hypothetical protein
MLQTWTLECCKLASALLLGSSLPRFQFCDTLVSDGAALLFKPNFRMNSPTVEMGADSND